MLEIRGCNLSTFRGSVHTLNKYRNRLEEKLGKKVFFNSEVLVSQEETEAFIMARSKISSGLGLQSICKNVVTDELHLLFSRKPSKHELQKIKHILRVDFTYSVQTKISKVPSEIERVVKSLSSAQAVYTNTNRDNQLFSIRGFGACPKIGDSAFLVRLADINVLLDAGTNFEDNLDDYLDKPELQIVDVVILSHAHTDHVGKIAALLKKYPNMKVIATAGTFILADYTLNQLLNHVKKICSNNSFGRMDIENLYKRAALVEPDKVYYISKQVKLTMYTAGHLPGSCMIKLESGNRSLLYTGDLSIKSTFVLPGVTANKIKADNVVIESTYGSKVLKPRKDVVQEFHNQVKATLDQQGKVLCPVLVLGRFVEVLSELHKLEEKEKYFSKNNIKIYLDGYLHTMKEIYLYLLNKYPYYFNPSEIKFLKSVLTDGFNICKSIRKEKTRSVLISDSIPAVILSSSGMLSGRSDQYFQELMENSKNLLALTSYQVPNTKGARLIEFLNDSSIHGEEFFGLKMKAQQFHLSAHNSYEDTQLFLGLVNPNSVYLIHASDENASSQMNELNSSNPSYSVQLLPKDKLQVLSDTS